MKKTFYLAAAAALLMASSVAHAGGFSFEIDGQRIHIDAPRHCNSLSCISVTNNGSPINMRKLNPKGKKSDDDDDVASNAPTGKQPTPAAQAPAPAQAPVANNVPPAPPAPPAPPPPATTYAPPAPAADATRERLSGLPESTTRTPPPAPSANAAPVANAAPASQPVVANPPPAQQAAPAATNPPAPPPPANAAADPNSPVGLWQTADNKGNVRIEQCGANLCGYAEKTNERILINMKPSGEKWTGRIHDPDSGSNYDSIIAMKGPNLLNVKGCAFGGLFCGGQTWKRIG